MEKSVVSAKRADFQEISRKFGVDPVIRRLIHNGNRLQMKKLRGIFMEETFRFTFLETFEKGLENFLRF